MAILTNSGRAPTWSWSTGVTSAQGLTIFANQDALILNNVN